MVESVIYTFGGTVQAGGGIYIPRDADQELLRLCRDAIFAYVLTPRQMGKSSLMVRTAETLMEEGINSVIVDLQELGAQVTAEQWYFGFLVKLDDHFMFETDVVSWWREHEHLGVSQRLTLFFEQVLLAEVAGQVVIFVDEIDTTLSLDFTDDFFTAVRYLYVARATNSEFRRLSFVLLGVATPGDLIRDAKRTPFNIGQRVDLTDFSFDEALPFADGLGLARDEAQLVFGWVLKWTGGHPYLTQRLCGALVEEGRGGGGDKGRGGGGERGDKGRRVWGGSLNEDEINRIVRSTFFGVMSDQDHNLQFVRDMLTKRAPDAEGVLITYREIRRGRNNVLDEEQSIIKSHLKLSGAVKREGKVLQVRNLIYQMVFDNRWISTNLPVNWTKRLQQAAVGLIGSVLFLSVPLAVFGWYQYFLQAERERESLDIFASNLNSESLMAANSQIEALAESLKAGQQIQQVNKDVNPDTRTRSIATLRQVLYTIKERNRLEGHNGYVLSVAFSPDGKTIASSGDDSTVRLWNLQGQQLQSLKGHNGDVWSVAFSPDGKTIASSGDDSTVRLWNLQGQQLQSLKGHNGDVWSVAFSPDGKTIASSGEDSTVRLWNLQGQQLQTLKGHNGDVRSVAFSPDGKTIASSGLDRTVRLWNLQGQQLQSLKGHNGIVWSVAFSPDGKTIASSGLDRTVRLWNLQGQQLQSLKGHNGIVWSVAFSPDGKTIASSGDDSTVRLWNLQGQQLQSLKGHNGRVWSVAFSPDGKTIASSGDDSTVRLWNLQGQQLQSLKGHNGDVWSVAFSPDGKTIASSGDDSTVRLWNLQGQQLQSLKGHNGDVWSVAFSPDGKTIASSGEDSTVRLWNLQGQQLQTLKGHNGDVRSVAFSPDGKTIASSGLDRTVRLWNLQGQQLQSLKGHNGIVWSVAFSPDGKTIASSGLDRTVRLWNLQGQQLQSLKGHNGIVWSVAFSPDGKTIASSGDDSTVRLWNLQGQQLQTLKGHNGDVRSVAFSPDGKTIASSGDDSTVRLWNLQGQQLQSLKGHNGDVRSVAFSPDGKTIASSGDDSTVRLWNLNLESLLQLGCEWLQDYLISHPETLGKLKQCQIQNPSLVKAAADTLIIQGKELAAEGDYAKAVAKFKKAKEWNPKLEINPEKKAAPAFVQQGREKAAEGDFAAVVAQFKKAQQLDSQVDLEPDTKELENNPEAVARKVTVPVLVQQGEELVNQGDVKKASEKYTEAQKLDPSLKISAESWRRLCWDGSLNNHAADVMFGCEKAVSFASKQEQANAKVARGLARALTGNRQGAISDFEVYIQSKDIPAESKKQIQDWVEALRAGKNPFTPEILRELRGE